LSTDTPKQAPRSGVDGFAVWGAFRRSGGFAEQGGQPRRDEGRRRTRAHRFPQTLSWFSARLKNKELRDSLLQAQTAQEVYNLLTA
jgi:hypothetical protein